MCRHVLPPPPVHVVVACIQSSVEMLITLNVDYMLIMC